MVPSFVAGDDMAVADFYVLAMVRINAITVRHVEQITDGHRASKNRKLQHLPSAPSMQP